jgi:RNA polymerase sigma-70 factor (ECF subfamily)
MVFGKSITFDENGVSDAAHAARPDSAFTTAENDFLDRLRVGESDAFDTLVCRYSGDIYALLVRITQNPDEAGDLTQETFLRAFKAIRRFRGDSELKTWLFRIAINESRNRHRWWKRRFREKTVSLDDSVGDTDVRLHETLSNGAADPESIMLRREHHKALEIALASLPEAYREVIVLRDIEGQSYQEIADVLKINIGTVKSRIARGREELRHKLSDF